MTPQELKNSILQLAIQGKLVEQRPEEGTAEGLFKQIQAEKQALIKAGKIKKEKPLPEITEDEIPFEIPKSWKWVRLNSVLESILVPQRDKPQVFEGTIPWCRIEDVDGKYLNGTKSGQYVSSETVQAMNLKVNPIGTVISANSASVGEAAITTVECVTNQTFIGLVCLSGLYNEYLYYYLIANKTSLRKMGSGTTIMYVSQDKYKKMLFPLPPLAEQKRIVAKIEELLPLIERYEKAWSRLEDFNKRFPGDMQESILQMAIQGRLVEQRPEEGTSEELYRRIQTEKQALIKAGKIKKEKPLSEITEDEIPFEIPESWKWVRLGILTELITSGSRDWAQFYSESGDIFLRMGNLSRNSFQLRLDKIQHVSLPEKAEGQRTSLQEGDLLFSITGEVGTLGLIPPNFGKAYINQHTAIIRFILAERNLYIPHLLLTDYAQKYYNGNQHGIKNSFRLDSISLMPVPLPPLSEQKRIVARLEELLPLCERLK